MESYVEVTFLNDFLIGVLAFYGSAFFSLSKMQARSFFLLLFIEQLFHILCFDESLFFLFYLYEIFFYFFLFHRQPKKGVMYFCLKYLLMFTCFKIFGGSFHLFHYYVPSSIRIYGLWLIFVLLIVLLKEKWSSYLRVSDFIYDVTIIGDKKIKVRGYLDTGNSLCVQNIPVLFLDESFVFCFNSFDQEKISFSTLNKEEEINVYLCEVQIDRYKSNQYYICCDKKVLLEWNCRCILNVEI